MNKKLENPMKMNKMPRFVLTIVFVLFFALGSLNAPEASAQPPLPDHGEPGDFKPQDENGPIGSGIAILLSLGAAYGAKRVYDARKKLRE